VQSFFNKINQSKFSYPGYLNSYIYTIETLKIKGIAIPPGEIEANLPRRDRSEGQATFA